MRILIVDDIAPLARALSRFLKDYQVTCVQSVGEVREILSKERFDLILSDVMMPEETGADLFHWVSDNFPDMRGKMIFMTGGIPCLRTKRRIEETGAPCLSKMDLSHIRTVVTSYVG